MKNSKSLKFLILISMIALNVNAEVIIPSEDEKTLLRFI